MINCHESRGKGTVFLLVIYLALSYCCNFDDDPISSDYMKKIKMLEDYLLADYQVDMPKVISEEKEDQNCKHLLTLFLSNYTLSNLRPGPKLEKIIKDLQNEFYFVEECQFKIPSACPTERVYLSNTLQNLSVSLAALKPNILNNFSHCLHIKCATAEDSSKLRSTTTRRTPNKSQRDSEEHTTPTVKLPVSSSDHGGHAKQSSGNRSHYMPIVIVIGILFAIALALILWNRCSR